MTEVDDGFFILQCVNFTATIVFLLLFVWRLWSLRNQGISQRYLSTTEFNEEVYPKPRIILAVIYVCISIAFLAFNIVQGQFQNGWLYLFSGGGGECINSIILILQLKVLREELKKERPYTRTHLVYSIYLVFISCVRFILTLYYLLSNVEEIIQKVDLALSVFLMLDSALLLGYWLVKRQEWPVFSDPKHFNIAEFNIQSKDFSRNRKFTQTQNSRYLDIDDFPLIFPTVTVERGFLRVTLEVFASNTLLELKQTNQRPEKISKRLEVIAQKLITAEDMREFYVHCGRFNIETKLRFVETNYVELLHSTHKFLNELFTNPANYQSFVMQFFDISPEIIRKYSILSRGKSLLQQDQTTRLDSNAPILSISLYKHLWIDDHYQYYMRVVTSDETHKTHPMRRFTDFQEFDDDLRNLINLRKNNNWKLQLPQLQKKYHFYWDQEKVTLRRKELEIYIRKIANDSCLMEYPQIRDRIFVFLNLRIYNVAPMYRKGFYKGLDLTNGCISKALIASQYVTFYEFKLFNNGIQINTIKKRYREFVQLHEDLKRWMNNVRITYESIQLPQRHLFSSQESHRHQKLLNYLKSVIRLRDVFKIYEVGVFLNIAIDKTLNDDSLFGPISVVKTNKGENRESLLIKDTDQPQLQRKWIQGPASPAYSYYSRQMSQSIEELGKYEDFNDI